MLSQSYMSTVGLGIYKLFRQLLSSPVYATVYLSLIGLSVEGIVISAQHGPRLQRLSRWPSGWSTGICLKSKGFHPTGYR